MQIENAFKFVTLLGYVFLGSVFLGVMIPGMNANTAESVLARQPWMNTQLSADQRVDKLLAAMTADEKQLLLFGYLGATFPENCTTAPCYHPPKEALEGSAGYIPGIARLGIPAQFQTDASLGVATQVLSKTKRERVALPSGLGSAASWDTDLAFKGGVMIGDEARRSGFNVMLAGGVNLLREPRNGRNFEYAGEDPLLAGAIVGAQVAGIQSNHIVSTLKHFALNDQETDRHFINVSIDPSAARVSDLFAFQLALERSHAGSIMASYNLLNGKYASENSWLLKDVLRRDWRFEGYVMSDWGGVHSAAPAANAGLDQESGFPFDVTPYFQEPLKESLRKGEVGAARLDEMARRILRSMFAHGLFEHPARIESIDYSSHAEVSRKAAEQSIVLLKNDGAVLPLKPNVKQICVIGGFADLGVLAGGGSSLVYPIGGNAVPGIRPTSWPGPVMYYPSSPLAEIRKLAGSTAVVFENGADQNGAVRAARNCEVAIVFATQWAGEAFDVALSVDAPQDQLIWAVASANPRTVVVLETGGPVLMPWAKQVAGIVEAWYPGTSGGSAIANVLFGRVNPSGHLPATFPMSLEQLPHPNAPSSREVNYSEGAAVGYKWFDLQKHEPLFAFGHGLSYSTFEFSQLKVSATKQQVVAKFSVSNTSSRDGMAVPQIYVSGEDWESPKRLGGWKKVSVPAGATQHVEIAIDPRLFATFDSALNRWQIAAGNYRAILANSSNDLRETVVFQLSAASLPAGWRPDPSIQSRRR